MAKISGLGYKYHILLTPESDSIPSPGRDDHHGVIGVLNRVGIAGIAPIVMAPSINTPRSTGCMGSLNNGHFMGN